MSTLSSSRESASLPSIPPSFQRKKSQILQRFSLPVIPPFPSPLPSPLQPNQELNPTNLPMPTTKYSTNINLTDITGIGDAGSSDNHLSLPPEMTEVYRDKSPKGSVDEGIRELINEINSYEGLVTTSSCAGRVSIFVDGGAEMKEGKGENEATMVGKHEVGHANDLIVGQGVATENREIPISANVEETATNLTKKTIPLSGKGGGKFLFVSHDPIDEAGTLEMSECLGKPWQDDRDETSARGAVDTSIAQDGQKKQSTPGIETSESLVRFAFEPMILHIMTASLQHAKPLLSATINSGFRESGVQSLKNLDDQNACPMVAVRTAGLKLEAIVGYLEPTKTTTSSNTTVRGGRIDGDKEAGPNEAAVKEDVVDANHEDAEERGRCPQSPPIKYLVDSHYRNLLIRLANERFAANRDRVERFRQALKVEMAKTAAQQEKRREGTEENHNSSHDRESKAQRRERKRREGLEKRELVRKDKESEDVPLVCSIKNEPRSGNQDPIDTLGSYLSNR